MKKIKKWAYCLGVSCCSALLAGGWSNLAFAQADRKVQEQSEESRKPVFTVVEQQPEFPGGQEARKKFFADHLQVGKSESRKKKKVFVSFIVNTDGSWQDVTLLKGLGEKYDQEALRVVNLMPRWDPGRQAGRPVRVKYILPVEF